MRVEMRDVVVRLAAAAELFISVAAVADYRRFAGSDQKIKKGLARQNLSW